MCSDLEDRLKNRPEVYLSGVQALVNAYNKTCKEKSDNAVASVLYKMKGLLRTGKYINVQPTALARRTTHLGGRRIQQTGKPPNASIPREHGYGRPIRRKIDRPTPGPRSRHVAPHSLSHRVESIRK